MAITEAYTAPALGWLRTLAGLLYKPARLQIAALCYRWKDGELEVLLVTSREKGRWILPKGWPELDQEAFETAVTEAFEEAGARGRPDRRAFGSFRSHKGLSNGLELRTKVLVFPIEVDRLLEDFPEKGQRQRAWMPVARAIEMADEPGARALLRRFAKRKKTPVSSRPQTG
ncbi:NTP pyrophosphohydrolase [Roseibium aquae]|uniref:NTP pyrophosphohydrolase n=1 Tax=Roseibium aquae TaxID=1323746 RepID=A0A916X2N0_9HYPH|nr:NUDIX hydrolase [Roseibium aquae]GGB54714.1 NTP pyrophosphohydrolase [Roseibium aquae]